MAFANSETWFKSILNTVAHNMCKKVLVKFSVPLDMLPEGNISNLILKRVCLEFGRFRNRLINGWIIGYCTSQLEGGQMMLEKGQFGFATLDSILIKNPVQMASSLPSNDVVGTQRMVLETNSYYFKTASGWVRIPDMGYYTELLEDIRRSAKGEDGVPGRDGRDGMDGLSWWPTATAISTTAGASTSAVNPTAVSGRTVQPGDLIISSHATSLGYYGVVTAVASQTSVTVLTVACLRGTQGNPGTPGSNGSNASPFWSGGNTGGNCNNITTPGCYSGNWSSGQPTGTSWGTLLLLASDTGASYREQIFIQEGQNRMWFRGSPTAAWAEVEAVRDAVDVNWVTNGNMFVDCPDNVSIVRVTNAAADSYSKLYLNVNSRSSFNPLIVMFAFPTSNRAKMDVFGNNTSGAVGSSSQCGYLNVDSNQHNCRGATFIKGFGGQASGYFLTKV